MIALKCTHVFFRSRRFDLPLMRFISLFLHLRCHLVCLFTGPCSFFYHYPPCSLRSICSGLVSGLSTLRMDGSLGTDRILSAPRKVRSRSEDSGSSPPSLSLFWRGNSTNCRVGTLLTWLWEQMCWRSVAFSREEDPYIPRQSYTSIVLISTSLKMPTSRC